MALRCALCLVLVLALGACEEKPGTPAPSSAPAVKTGLFIADEPVVTPSALAIGTEGETALRFVLSTGQLSCGALAKAYPERPPPGGTMLDFWLMQPMEADGSRGPWAFRSAYLTDDKGGRGMTARGGLCNDVIQAGDQVTVKGLELALGDATKQHELLWTGDLVAELCPRARRPEPARPQKDLAMSIAGEAVRVAGATIRPEGQQVALRLTSAPHDCNSIFTEGYDAYLTLMLEGDPLQLKVASLQGDVFPGFPSGSEGKESFTLELDTSPQDKSGSKATGKDSPGAPDAGPLAGEGPVVVTLAGTLGLRGYAVKLDGKLEALRCKPAETDP